MNYRMFLFIITVCFASTCNGKKIKLEEKYIGFWYESSWVYEFDTNGNFIFTTGGHFGESTERGRYKIIEDQVFLIPDNDWHEEDVFKKELFIYSNNCLRDNDNNFYCTSEEELKEVSE